MTNFTAPISGTALHAERFQWSLYIVPAIAGYVLLCNILRFRRRDAIAGKYGFADRKSLSGMTNVQAQEIITVLAELEFPKIYLTSLQFALFKTYGIPTISNLLVATKELSTSENSGKRYSDTNVLIAEFSSHHPKSERVLKALARMNYIHSHYIKTGKITQNDLLYTLSVFVSEPVTWVRDYEWREFSEIEICAVGTFWKSIGDAMGIEYAGRLAQTQWMDGLDFYADLMAWARRYETQNMVPAPTNKKTADELIPLLLLYVPRIFKQVATKVVSVLMGDLLRTAMIYPKPSQSYFLLVNSVFAIRRFFLRYLALPRPGFLRVREVTKGPPNPKTGRYHLTNYTVYPFYNKPGFWNRWGPEAWLVWTTGGDLPGSKGSLYMPEGYVFEEVGPVRMRNKGLAEMKEEEERLNLEMSSGCPFAFAK